MKLNTCAYQQHEQVRMNAEKKRHRDRNTIEHTEKKIAHDDDEEEEEENEQKLDDDSYDNEEVWNTKVEYYRRKESKRNERRKWHMVIVQYLKNNYVV